MSLRETAWKWVAGAGVATIGAYFLVPTLAGKDIAYVMIGFVSVVVMGIGVRIHRPVDRRCWYLLLAGSMCSVGGDGVSDVYDLVLHRALPFPSVADALYLAAYPFIFAGVIRLCRAREDPASRENHADAAIIGIAALALSWHFLMGSYAHDQTIGAFGKLVLLAYPIMDIGLVFIIARSLLFGSARLPVHKIVMVALVPMLVADFVYDLLVLHNSYAMGNPIDAGWLLNYLLMGVAALHPSMARSPDVWADPTEARRRTPILALAGFVAPGILLIGSLVGASVDVPVLSGLAAILSLLVALRMAWLFQRIRAQTIQAQADAAALEESLAVRESLESDLRHQAFHDALTGLANRALLYNRVEHALSASERTPRLVALCFCDLDGFKTVNDTLGHQYGDELLTIASKRLKSIVRPGDTVARLGGDEFAVLMDDAGSPDVATTIAERIVAVLHEPATVAGRQITISVSVGVAFGGRHTTAEQLVSEADIAMYEAKASGKSRWTSFEASMHFRNLERLELINGFRGSLERGEFFLQYQPQFSLADGHLEGFEALLRWQHPTRGLVMPIQFIPLAEETGFITTLGRWVLETACEQAARWFNGRDAAMTMSVNLSGRQLQDANIGDDVRTALAMSGLPAQQLLLEFTESTLLADSEETTATLADLKMIGVQLALDDFGTGYSSLAYLRRLPLDVLKIDKSFIDPLVEPGEEGPALMSTIIRFARVLGLRTVAEGIEHQHQRQVLTELGCDSAQGFLFAPPLSAEQALALISTATPVHASS